MRGETPFFQRLDLQIRGLLPVVTTVLLLLVGLIPWHLPSLAMITPAYPLIAVYFWSIYQPHRLPFWVTFLIGVLQDLLLGMPVGQAALGLLLIQGLVVSQRRFFIAKPFRVVWWGFAIVAPLSAALSWATASIVRDGFVPVLPVVAQTVVTVLLYPVFGGVFGWIQQKALQTPQ